MLEQLVGEKVLRRGLKAYMNKHKYGSTVTRCEKEPTTWYGKTLCLSRDLWNALSGAIKGKVDVAAMMDTWTQQLGFPIITLERDNSSSKTQPSKKTASARWSAPTSSLKYRAGVWGRTNIKQEPTLKEADHKIPASTQPGKEWVQKHQSWNSSISKGYPFPPQQLAKDWTFLWLVFLNQLLIRPKPDNNTRPSRVVPVQLVTDKSVGKPQDFLIPATQKPYWCISLNVYSKNTITDGGSTATNSKAISGWIGQMDPT